MSGKRTRIMKQGERDDVMRRIYALTLRDQLEVHSVLSQHLGEKLDGETEFAKQARERREALDAMKRVAEHLCLAAGVPPTVTQYREVWNDAASDWSSARVIRAWGRYRLAEQAYRGESIPATAAQRSLQRHSCGKAHKYEPPLVGVRQWLATNPPSDTGEDYDNYVREHNNQLVRGEITGPALVQRGAARASLGLPWLDILRVARYEADAAPLQARYEKELLETDKGPLGVISTTTIGLVLNMIRQNVFRARQLDEFPKPVVKISKHSAWLLEDVLAYREGQPFPRREEWEMQHLVMECEELAELLGKKPNGVRSAVHWQWPTVPEPDGRVGKVYYWLRENVEAWIQEREEHSGTTRTKNAGPDKRAQQRLEKPEKHR